MCSFTAETLCWRLWILQPSWAQNILQHKSVGFFYNNYPILFNLWNEHWTIVVVTVISCHTFFLGGRGKNKKQAPWHWWWENTPKSSTKISRLTADAKNVFQHPCHIYPEYPCPSQIYLVISTRCEFRVQIFCELKWTKINLNDPADTSTASQKIS